MDISFKPLGKVMQVASDAGLDISYAFDDLVFANNSVCIFRFDETNDILVHVYFNCDCTTDNVYSLKKQMETSARKHLLEINYAGTFRLHQHHQLEEIEIEFFSV